MRFGVECGFSATLYITMQINKPHTIFRVLAVGFLLAIFVFIGEYPHGTPLAQGSVLPEPPAGRLWHFQCIDTMKYSRDAARDYLNDPKRAEIFINKEVDIIKSLGTTCVSVGTPYDEEFIPYLRQWVNIVHSKGLNVWFRGNFSAWENWFSYGYLKNPEDHHAKLNFFITHHQDLFANGDILSPAPEAENGVLGNPWASSASAEALREFVWKSADTCQQAILAIKKQVSCGYFSANGDVARDIYNHDLLQKAGAVTVIDHYISSTVKYGQDLDLYAQKHGLPIVIGEFGAPIPDLNGDMNEDEQARFVGELFRQFYVHKKQILGLNYWVLRGGSTRLINDDGSERKVMEVVRDYFMPGQIAGTVVDGIGRKVKNAVITTSDGVQQISANKKGEFILNLPPGSVELTVASKGYSSSVARVETTRAGKSVVKVIVHPIKPSLWYRLRAKLGI